MQFFTIDLAGEGADKTWLMLSRACTRLGAYGGAGFFCADKGPLRCPPGRQRAKLWCLWKGKATRLPAL